MTASASRKERLRAWILANGKGIDDANLRDDTPLLERRIISSLQLAELLLFLGELRDEPVDLEKVSGAALRDLSSIMKTFLADEAPAHG